MHVRGGVRVCVRVHVRVRVSVRVRVRVYKCRSAGLSGIRSVRYRTEKTNNAGNGPVPDQTKAVRHFLVWYRTEIIDAGVSFLDADAQLWLSVIRQWGGGGLYGREGGKRKGKEN